MSTFLNMMESGKYGSGRRQGLTTCSVGEGQTQPAGACIDKDMESSIAFRREKGKNRQSSAIYLERTRKVPSAVKTLQLFQRQH